MKTHYVYRKVKAKLILDLEEISQEEEMRRALVGALIPTDLNTPRQNVYLRKDENDRQNEMVNHPLLQQPQHDDERYYYTYDPAKNGNYSIQFRPVINSSPNNSSYVAELSLKPSPSPHQPGPQIAAPQPRYPPLNPTIIEGVPRVQTRGIAAVHGQYKHPLSLIASTKQAAPQPPNPLMATLRTNHP